MNAHFTSFTPEAMRAFGQGLADGLQRRAESLIDARNETVAMLASFRRDHCGAEAGRRRRAGEDADARQLYVSELRSGVHALLNRFEMSREETAGDLQEMARQLRGASDAFRNRHGRTSGSFTRRSQKPKQTQSGTSGPSFAPAATSQDGPTTRSRNSGKPERSKKRPG